MIWSMFSFCSVANYLKIFSARWANIWSWEMKAFWPHLGNKDVTCEKAKLQLSPPHCHWDRWMAKKFRTCLQIFGAINIKKLEVNNFVTLTLKIQPSANFSDSFRPVGYNDFLHPMYSFPPAPSLSGDGGRFILCWPPSGLGDERRLPPFPGPGLCETLLMASFCVLLVLFRFSRGLN
jgi:hypothetical protein